MARVPVPEGRVPVPGDVVLLTRRASVQFVTPTAFRVIRVLTEQTTFDGWVWLHGYQLDAKGRAVAKRDVFVQPAGLRAVSPATWAPARPRDRRTPPADRSTGGSVAPGPRVPSPTRRALARPAGGTARPVGGTSRAAPRR